jgi:hypothetical protein
LVSQFMVRSKMRSNTHLFYFDAFSSCEPVPTSLENATFDYMAARTEPGKPPTFS